MRCYGAAAVTEVCATVPSLAYLDSPWPKGPCTGLTQVWRDKTPRVVCTMPPHSGTGFSAAKRTPTQQAGMTHQVGLVRTKPVCRKG